MNAKHFLYYLRVYKFFRSSLGFYPCAILVYASSSEQSAASFGAGGKPPFFPHCFRDLCFQCVGCTDGTVFYRRNGDETIWRLVMVTFVGFGGVQRGENGELGNGGGDARRRK